MSDRKRYTEAEYLDNEKRIDKLMLTTTEFVIKFTKNQLSVNNCVSDFDYNRLTNAINLVIVHDALWRDDIDRLIHDIILTSKVIICEYIRSGEDFTYDYHSLRTYLKSGLIAEFKELKLIDSRTLIK